MSVKTLLALLLVTAATPVFAASQAVDDSALRYYASHNEPERLAAELQRLRKLYPDWQPPADLTAPVVDREAPLWELFAKDDLDGITKAVEVMKVSDPNFTLSDDLAGKIQLKIIRRELLKASQENDATAVVALADQNPGLGGCGDLDAAWRIAAARHTTGNISGARADYERLLKDCKDIPGRAATLGKAVILFGPEVAREVSASLITEEEREAMRPAFARAAILAALADPENTAAEPDPADLEALITAAAAGPAPDDAAMLGWWYRARGEHEKALSQFQTAATLAGAKMDAKIAEGIILSLSDLDQRDTAIRIAHDNRELSPDIAKLYVDLGANRFAGEPRPDLPASDIEDYANATTSLNSAFGAEVLGWYHYDRKELTEARRWFDMAIGITPSEGAAKGAILAAYADKDPIGAKTLTETYAESFPTLADIRWSEPAKKGTSNPKVVGKDAIIVAFEAKNYRRCVEKADARGKLPADLSLIRGWCLMKLDRPVDAIAAFERAESGPKKVRADAAYGKSLAMLAAGHVDSAAATAVSAIAEPERRNEIGVAVLADRAQARFNSRDWMGTLQALDQRAAFAREPADLAMLRGWSYWHSGRREEARRIFAMLDQTLSTKATRAAIAQTQGY